MKKAGREAVGFEEVAGAIAREYGEPWEELGKRRGHPAKGLAILMCRRHTGLKLREIGERCHRMDYAAVSQACRRMEEKISRDPRLSARAKRITKQLRMYNVET